MNSEMVERVGAAMISSHTGRMLQICDVLSDEEICSLARAAIEAMRPSLRKLLNDTWELAMDGSAPSGWEDHLIDAALTGEEGQ